MHLDGGPLGMPTALQGNLQMGRGVPRGLRAVRLPSWVRQQETLSFSPFVCLFSFPFLPLASKVSLQREKMVPPAASQVARQNYPYHLHLQLLCQKDHAGSPLDGWQSSITLPADTSCSATSLGSNLLSLTA